jgi:RNA polymerase sigma-70 factor, ECF subfamily
LSQVEELEQQLQNARSAFGDVVGEIRPDLHRYCARMTGSVLDGEDLVQEVLATAFFKLSQYRNDLPIRPWLFRIAHNRCIDFLRARGRVDEASNDSSEVGWTAKDPAESAQETSAALALLLEHLPPKERSCLLLKDLMGYNMAEIASLTGSTEGAVKSALHRAREKVTGLPPVTTVTPAAAPSALLVEYLERFNARDWDGVTDLLSADARLAVVGIHESEGVEAVRDTYMHNYDTMSWPWWFEIVDVGGRDAALCWRHKEDGWHAHSICLYEWSADGRVTGIRDYIPASYLLREASVPPSPVNRGLLSDQARVT